MVIEPNSHIPDELAWIIGLRNGILLSVPIWAAVIAAGCAFH
jgi:hypothetical protein